MSHSAIGHSIRWGRRNGNERDVFYTPEALARLCMQAVPIVEGDTIFDPCAGLDAFYGQFPEGHKVGRCEIAEGDDFYEHTERWDWLISNPPYSHLDTWLEHSAKVAAKGFAYLLGWNNLTARRLETLEGYDFGLTGLTMFKVFKWYGMSAFCVWERDAVGMIGYDRTVWR